MINELSFAGGAGRRIRIPPEMDVPVTPRVAKLIDTAAMRRLSRVSQLGLVHLVYPGATHSRLEHSLGVYRNALLTLGALLSGPVPPGITIRHQSAEAFIVAALLHDLGHWPFCHPIEDMGLIGVIRHEHRIEDWLDVGGFATLIKRDWCCTIPDVLSLLTEKWSQKCGLSEQEIVFFRSCLSGPVDIDKMDYLVRDSVHAGVPYGRNFDVARLVAAMAVDPGCLRVAITEKGRTAAELMVVARYVMFSEVYWHHAVRSATAMLQRAVFEIRDRIDLNSMAALDDSSWVRSFIDASEATKIPAVKKIVDGLFGSRRMLYKRVAEFSVSRGLDIHYRLAHRPYHWLAKCADNLAAVLKDVSGKKVLPGEVIIDSPPVKLEVDINVSIIQRDGTVQKLANVSPVAESLAHQQFDGHVKKIRIFISPELRELSANFLKKDEGLIFEAIKMTEAQFV